MASAGGRRTPLSERSNRQGERHPAREQSRAGEYGTGGAKAARGAGVDAPGATLLARGAMGSSSRVAVAAASAQSALGDVHARPWSAAERGARFVE